MQPTDYRLVKVIWDDAESANERWISVSDATKDEPTLCTSVGWLIKETESKIHLAASLVLGDSDQVSGHVSIPRAMIKSIEDLSVKRKRTKRENIA